jgi:hypothetical protein
VEASRLKLTTPRSVVHGSRLNNNRNKYNSDNNNDHDDDDSINIKRQGSLCCRSTAPWGSAGHGSSAVVGVGVLSWRTTVENGLRIMRDGRMRVLPGRVNYPQGIYSAKSLANTYDIGCQVGLRMAGVIASNGGKS